MDCTATGLAQSVVETGQSTELQYCINQLLIRILHFASSPEPTNQRPIDVSDFAYVALVSLVALNLSPLINHRLNRVYSSSLNSHPHHSPLTRFRGVHNVINCAQIQIDWCAAGGVLTDIGMSHNVAQHGYLLSRGLHHLIHRRLGTAVHRQVDNFGGKLAARLLFDASSDRRTDAPAKAWPRKGISLLLVVVQ